MKLEKMTDFFTARAEEYDEHMLCEVPGCRAGYIEMAKRLPEGISRLLDLGCGTGLELEPIFARFPGLCVTGIDLTQEMLRRLADKFSEKNLRLICGDYLKCELGGDYDAAVSFQTMHHFTYEEKAGLYRRIYDAVRPGGIYIECDYMVTDPKEEAFYFAENSRLRAEAGAKMDEYYHYDTPLTVQHQMQLLKEAGFIETEQVFREGNTTMLVCRKAVSAEEKERNFRQDDRTVL